MGVALVRAAVVQWALIVVIVLVYGGLVLFEKVNPGHPDKVADRIAGAIVDEAYRREANPRVAVEVLVGHGACHIINESSVAIPVDVVVDIVHRIVGDDEVAVDYVEVPQDPALAANQEEHLSCGDNGIFKGVPVTDEQKRLRDVSDKLWDAYGSDGKYVLHDNRLVVCQSKATDADIRDLVGDGYDDVVVNPLGEWTGGTMVDTGATNRKLGSDMGDAVTGGGLHGKDLSKTDVSMNIYAYLEAQRTGKPVEYSCAIGDTEIDGIPYADIVNVARGYIDRIGGFEKLAEWGLV